MQSNSISGYVLLSMPTDQVKPLKLLTREKKGIVNITNVGIDDLFTNDETAIPVSEDFKLSSNINNNLTLDVSVDAHVSLLQILLQYVKLSVGFSFQKTKSVKVHLLEAKTNAVNEFKLDNYINNAQVRRVSKTFTDMLVDNNLFIVTDILKCKKYTLSYSDDKTTAGGMEVGSELIGDVSAKTKVAKSGIDTLQNEGEDYITIGLKAYRIYCEGDKKTGQLTCRIRKSPEPIRRILADEDFPGELLEEISINLVS